MKIIHADVLNIGKNAQDKITAELSSNIEGEIEILEIDSLDEDEIHTFNFNWTPNNLGVQTLTLEIFFDGDLHDSIISDVTITIGDYEWWNENWHYRYILSIEGEGNFSSFFNFTKILENLGLFSKNFENDTIRVVEYKENGEVLSVVENYSFVESNGFNNTYNATGNLSWYVSDESDYKTYIIYFDVSENIGIRSVLLEKIIGNISQDFSIIFDEIYQSWWSEIVNPKESSILLVNKPVNFSIVSSAKIALVKGFAYLDNNKKNNFTFNFSYIIDD